MSVTPETPLTTKPIISADSHVTEPEGTYDDIDPKFRDNRPVFLQHEGLGPCFQIPYFPMPVPTWLDVSGCRNFSIDSPDMNY